MVRRLLMSLVAVAATLTCFGCNDGKSSPAATGTGKGAAPGTGAVAPGPPAPPPG